MDENYVHVTPTSPGSNITITATPFVQTGWICPKCGRVFAPFVSECHYCNNPQIITNTTSYPNMPITGYD